MAGAIELAGIGAHGSGSAGSETLETLESAALSPSAALLDGFAASPAKRLHVGISENANAAVAIIVTFNLMVVS